jgi:DNA primase
MEGGNAISFVTKTMGMGFMEAVVYLSELTGVELKFDDGAFDPGAYRKGREKKRQLLDVNREANAYFQSALHEPQGLRAREYILRRGLNSEVVSRFQVGCAPAEGNGLYDVLVRRGGNLALAEELGLVWSRSGRAVDRFRDRLMFPIVTASEDIAGFSGRTLDPEGIPKYLNSPESEVFRKGGLVFGLVQAREAIKKLGHCILVEGQLDVLALHQAGISNVAAPLGTALTADQCGVIRRFADAVYLMFDGDDAGRKATWRGMELLIQQGVHGKVISPPQGEDPDSVLRKAGVEALRKLMDSAVPFLEYAVGVLAEEGGSSMHGRAEAGRSGSAFAGHIEDRMERELFLDNLARRLDLSRRQLSGPAVTGTPAGRVSAVRPLPSISRTERRLVEIVLMAPRTVTGLLKDDQAFGQIRSPAVRNFLTVVGRELEEEGDVDPNAMIDAAGEPELRSIAGELSLSGSTPGARELEEEMEHLQLAMRRKYLKEEMTRRSAEIKDAEQRGDDSRLKELALEFEEVFNAAALLDR